MMADITLPTLATATEVFASGFTFTRNRTHPYLSAKVAPTVWRLHDGARKRGDYRSEEIVGLDVTPTEIADIAQTVAQSKYKICYLLPDGADDTPVRGEFKQLGFRLMATEDMMVHSLQALPEVASPTRVVRMETDKQAQVFAKTTQSKILPREQWHGANAPLRQYLAYADEEGENPVGWVGSVRANGAAWCTQMFVNPAFRRRGIASALLAQMLTDDKAHGASANVLLASHAGSKLYPTVGYARLGTLYLYTPPKA